MEKSVNAFHLISPYLPESVLQGLRSTPVDELALDNLVRLISGAEPSANSVPDLREGWSTKRQNIATVLLPLARSNDSKRSLEDSEHDPTAKRPRLSPPESSNQPDIDVGRPLFTLSSISITAPVRKKVDINIQESAIVLMNSTTKAMDTPPISLSALRRAFLLPTRGKTKPHWTIVILSSDSQTSHRGKTTKALNDDNPQIVFGVDAKLTSAISTTTYDAQGTPTTTAHPKNTDSISILREFLSHLNIPLFEPTPSIFRSAVPGLSKSAIPEGVPGIEAYRSAKPGSLWFMPEGILWGESKPCEFWAVEDMIGKMEGLKVIGGVGKTCSVILTRRSRPTPVDVEGGDKNIPAEVDEGEAEEDLGEETEFSMVDSKEKEGIEKWVRQYRHLFGTTGGGTHVEKPQKEENLASKGPLTIHEVGEDTDSSDEDFAVSDEDSSENASDSHGSEEDSEDGEEEDESEDEDEGGEAEGAAGSAGSDEGDSEDELDPKHHPLLRAGPLPRMSKAVMDMAVGMVMNDVVGGGSDEEEVDELME